MIGKYIKHWIFPLVLTESYILRVLIKFLFYWQCLAFFYMFLVDIFFHKIKLAVSVAHQNCKAFTLSVQKKYIPCLIAIIAHNKIWHPANFLKYSVTLVRQRWESLSQAIYYSYHDREGGKRVDPLTPKISLVILLTVSYIVLVMLV